MRKTHIGRELVCLREKKACATQYPRGCEPSRCWGDACRGGWRRLVSKHEGNPTYTGNGLHDCRALFDAGEPSYGYEAQDGHAGGRVVDALERRGEHRQDIWANFSGRMVRNARVESLCVLRGVGGWVGCVAVSAGQERERERRIEGMEREQGRKVESK